MFAKLRALFRMDVKALESRLAAVEQSAIADVDEIAKRISAKVLAGIRKEIAAAKKPKR